MVRGLQIPLILSGHLGVAPFRGTQELALEDMRAGTVAGPKLGMQLGGRALVWVLGRPELTSPVELQSHSQLTSLSTHSSRDSRNLL